MAKKKSDSEKTPSAEAARPKPYVVLARKYRPQSFDDLIGQEAMVKTLRNAFASGRIAQAYMLTGVRGVGKTTTARIIARALNYETDTVKAPTIDMPVLGTHCAEIMESRHPDVIEMDAASNTGVDNIRELIESARYKPIIARTKVFIIDEVHMLSKGAFNALLKTLEEPPEHVKFIFATTEIRKVPVTVLSRTQRFDLRRVDVPELSAHFAKIVASEGATADDDALALIARSAEGSVRDGLSLLDQAIAMGEGAVRAETVRSMLGLADRGRIFDLIEHVFRGDAKAALTVRWTTASRRRRADPAAGRPGRSGSRRRARQGRRRRSWQRGPQRRGTAPRRNDRRQAVDAAAVARLADAAEGRRGGGEGRQPARRRRDGADPPRLYRRSSGPRRGHPPAGWRRRAGAQRQAGSGRRRNDTRRAAQSGRAGAAREYIASAAHRHPPRTTIRRRSMMRMLGFDADYAASLGELASDDDAPAPGTLADPRSFDEVIALAGERRDMMLKLQLEDRVSLVKFDYTAGSIDLFLLPGAPPQLANELREKLNAWTQRKWVVVLSKAAGDRPRGEVRREREAAELEVLKAHPAVKAVLEQFPDAKIAEIRELIGAPRDETGTG